LSPLLFNLVGDVLTRMLKRASGKGHIKGILENFVPGGIMTLQYADDTILFSCGVRELRNMKIILMLFEKVSRMRINLSKSEFIPMNLDVDQVHEVAHVLNFPLGSLPFQYLGVPIHFEKLNREDLQPVIDKLVKKVAGWRGRLLAYSSRLVLIKTCLASIPIYLLSFIKFSKWAIRLFESQMAHCLWNSNADRHKYHLASWQHVTMLQEYGGLGVPNIRELNLCLLGSWIRRYTLDDGKLWKNLVDFKYNTRDTNVFTCRDIEASNFWKGVLWAARVVKMGYRWNVGDDSRVRFWEDLWIGSSSLAIQYWELYCIVNEQNRSIAELWDEVNLKCTFRRCVNMRLLSLWEELLGLVSTIELSDEEDALIW
jgi:hypothetical protein